MIMEILALRYIEMLLWLYVDAHMHAHTYT